MPQARYRYTDFSGGELSPLIDARVDLDRYGRGCRILENYLILQGGGVMRRPGTHFVAWALGTGRARLIPFIRSELDALVLEFTDHQIRFYAKNVLIRAGVFPDAEDIVVATPYAESELFQIRWVQSVDVLFLVHPNHPPQQLERHNADNAIWVFRPVPFDPPPSLEVGTRASTVGAVLTPSALSGSGVHASVSQAFLLDSDVGRTLVVVDGANAGAQAKIVAVSGGGGTGGGGQPTGSPTATVTIVAPFTSTAAIAPADWLLTDRRVQQTGAALDVERIDEPNPEAIRVTAGIFTQADVGLVIAVLHPNAQAGLRRTISGVLDPFTCLVDTPFPVPVHPIPSTEWRIADPRPQTQGVSITPSALSGTDVTVTASPAFWLPQDVNREILVESQAALALITAVGDSSGPPGPGEAQSLTLDITVPFRLAIPIQAREWLIAGSPLATLKISAKGPIGTVATLTLDKAGWRTSDVGHFVSAEGGLIEITKVDDSFVAEGRLRSIIDTTEDTPPDAPPDAWTLEEPAFSPDNGFPSVVTFFEDRLWFMATGTRPQTMWASKTGDYFNFAAGAQDDDGLAFTLNSDQQNPIRWAMPGGAKLLIGTSGEEWSLDPGEGNVLTPHNLPTAHAETSYGSTSACPALRIGNVTLFPTRSRRKIREMVFDFAQTNGFVAPDLTLIADHLTAPTRDAQGRSITRRIVDMTWQREPQTTVWMAREDGTLCGLTYLRDQNIVAWHRHILTDGWPTPASIDSDGRQVPQPFWGTVESVAVIPGPSGDRDQLWLSVARVSGPQEAPTIRRHVEYLDDIGHNFTTGLVVDAAVTYDGTNPGPLTLSASEGAGITFSSLLPAFRPEDVGAEVRVLAEGGGVARITAVQGPTVALGDTLGGTSFARDFPVVAASTWGVARKKFFGLTHLERRIVWINGDGAMMLPRLVIGGQIETEAAAVKAEIGLGITARLIANRPEISGVGTIQALPQRLSPLAVRVYKTLGLIVNGERIVFRTGDVPTNAATPPYTGDWTLDKLGWDNDTVLDLEATEPLPCVILGVFGLLAGAD